MSTAWRRIARDGAAAAALCAAASAEAGAVGIDATIDRAVRPVADLASGFIFYSVPFMGTELPLIVLWLIGGGLFFTVYLRFINLRGFRHALGLVAGRYDDPAHPGEISHFQALCTAVSGTVGIGNIAGVAVAISAGGPGATLWLIVAGLLGMSTKFAECTLGVRYRRLGPDGAVSGGPMYYLEHGLAERGLSGPSTRRAWWSAAWASATCSSPTRRRPSSST
jgi:AGCS family alanine or glycine:cation symporter